jgi:hypothetical protein
MFLSDFRLTFFTFDCFSLHCKTEPEAEMKVSIRSFLICLIILFFSSCTAIVYIGKRIDPEIMLDTTHHDILFVNLFDYTSGQVVKAKEENSYYNGVMSLLDGLSSFSNDSSYKLIVGDTLKKGIDKELLTTLLPVDSVITLCSRYKANLLLTIDSLSLFFEWETVSNDDYYGYNNQTKNLYLNCNFFVSLYNASGDLINRTELDQSLLYRSIPAYSGVLALQPSLSRAVDEISSLAFQAGQDYVAKFYPQYTQESRQLYTGRRFKESNGYIFARNWNKASELLEQLVKSPDPGISAKAENNLEVVKEALDANAHK